RQNLSKRKKRICGAACVLVVRVLAEGRRILVGDLQAKTAGLLEISPELFRPSPFSLPMVIVLVDPGPMELVDDRVKIVVGYRKCKVAASISGFRDFAQLADLIENYALVRRNSDNRHAVFLFDQIEIENTLVEIDARIQIGGIEMQVVDPRFTDSSSFRDLQEISLRILKDQSVVPATTQSALVLDVSHERARAADFFLHPLEFGFRNQEGMSRVRSRAVPLGKRRFSLGKESDMVFPQFHENSAHIRSVLSFQSSCPENFGVKLLGPIGIHDRNDKMIQMADITFSVRFNAHTETLLLFMLLTQAKVIEHSLFQSSPSPFSSPGITGEG